MQVREKQFFTAICRKNLGCTHFIIGRDHTGFKNNYSNKDLRTFFGEIGDIGINIIFFDMISFNEKTNKYCFNKKSTKLISGSIIRDLINKKKKIPKFLLDKNQQKIIKEMEEKIFLRLKFYKDE